MSEKTKQVHVTREQLARYLDEATAALLEQCDPAVRERVETAARSGDKAKADYWLAKALRLNTARGTRNFGREIAKRVHGTKSTTG